MFRSTFVENVYVKIIFIYAIFCLLEITCNAINCYQCSSLSDPGCDNLINSNNTFKYYQPCLYTANSGQPFCKKIHQTVHVRDGLNRITRSCGYIKAAKDCYTFEDDDHEEIVCQCFTDACNGASTNTFGIISAIVAAFVKLAHCSLF